MLHSWWGAVSPICEDSIDRFGIFTREIQKCEIDIPELALAIAHIDWHAVEDLGGTIAASNEKLLAQTVCYVSAFTSGTVAFFF